MSREIGPGAPQGSLPTGPIQRICDPGGDGRQERPREAARLVRPGPAGPGTGALGRTEPSMHVFHARFPCMFSMHAAFPAIPAPHARSGARGGGSGPGSFRPPRARAPAAPAQAPPPGAAGPAPPRRGSRCLARHVTRRRRAREGKGQRRRRGGGSGRSGRRGAEVAAGASSAIVGKRSPERGGGSGAASGRPAPSSGNPIGGGGEPRRRRRQSGGGGGGEEAAEASERPRRAESLEAQAERSEGIAAPREECQPPASTRYRPRGGGAAARSLPLPLPGAGVTRGGAGRRQGGHLHLPSPPGRRGSRPPPPSLRASPPWAAAVPRSRDGGPLSLFISADPRRSRSASRPERCRPGPRPRPLCV